MFNYCGGWATHPYSCNRHYCRELELIYFYSQKTPNGTGEYLSAGRTGGQNGRQSIVIIDGYMIIIASLQNPINSMRAREFFGNDAANFQFQ